MVELHARKIKFDFSTAIAYTMTPETALLKLSVRLSAREENNSRSRCRNCLSIVIVSSAKKKNRGAS